MDGAPPRFFWNLKVSVSVPLLAGTTRRLVAPMNDEMDVGETELVVFQMAAVVVTVLKA